MVSRAAPSAAGPDGGKVRPDKLVHHGIDAGSPKACFREAFKIGILTEVQAGLAMMMTDDRNFASYTYIEAIADLVYLRLHSHADLMSKPVVASI